MEAFFSISVGRRLSTLIGTEGGANNQIAIKNKVKN